MLGATDVVVCGGCSSSLHCQCIGLSVVPREPYYCNECLDEYERQGVVDVTLQRDLMKYLYNGTLPESLAA